MAWTKKQDGRLEPDGQLFDSPADSFETRYNQHIQEHGAPPDHDEIDTHRGWPYSTKAGEPKPHSSAEVRRLLDAFLSPHGQEKALDAGNTHDELDKITRDLLTWAVYYRTPILPTERNLAARLGVDVSGCPEQEDGRIRHHSVLGV